LLVCTVAALLVATAQAATTERVSIAADGTEANQGAGACAISADGRLVAFASTSDNLVSGDTKGWWDVFLRDVSRGTTWRISVTSGNPGTEVDGPSGRSAIAVTGSGDSRTIRVYFESDAYDLVSSDSQDGYTDVFVREIVGTTTLSCNTYLITKKDSSYLPANGPSFLGGAAIADPLYVAFFSWATDLTSGTAPDSTIPHAYFRKRSNSTNYRASVSNADPPVDGDRGSIYPAIALNGSEVLVAFSSHAEKLIGQGQDTNQTVDVYLRRE
jgi:hypothetical protein